MDIVTIPQSEETIVLELTVKEALALGSGVRFWGNPQTAAQARKKVRASLEQRLIPGTGRIFYEALE